MAFHTLFFAARFRRCSLSFLEESRRGRAIFARNLCGIVSVKQPDGTIKSLTPRQVADLLGHSTSEITEMHYVKKDTARLAGITEGFEL